MPAYWPLRTVILEKTGKVVARVREVSTQRMQLASYLVWLLLSLYSLASASSSKRFHGEMVPKWTIFFWLRRKREEAMALARREDWLVCGDDNFLFRPFVPVYDIRTIYRPLIMSSSCLLLRQGPFQILYIPSKFNISQFLGRWKRDLALYIKTPLEPGFHEFANCNVGSVRTMKCKMSGTCLCVAGVPKSGW